MAGGRGSPCCPSPLLAPGLWPVLPPLPPDTRRPGPPPHLPARRAQSPLPSPRHVRPELFSSPRVTPGPNSSPSPRPGPTTSSCPSAGPALSPPSCRHDLSLGHDCSLNASFFPTFPLTVLLCVFSGDSPVSLALVWVAGPRWACFPLLIQDIFAPIPTGLARWNVFWRLHCSLEHSIT